MNKDALRAGPPGARTPWPAMTGTGTACGDKELGRVIRAGRIAARFSN